MKNKENEMRSPENRFKMSRRKFLGVSSIATGSILASPLLAQLQAIAAPPIGATDGVLVVIFLGGGNDPLNTLAPYTSNQYRTLRPNLYLSPDSSDPLRKCLPISSSLGLHSSLSNIKSLYESGKVTFIPGAGYTGQDLSHFSSSAQYMFGWSGTSRVTTGWAGRYLDTFSDAASESTRGITINGAIPLVISGAVSQAISLPTYISDAYNANPNSDRSKFCYKDIANFSGSSSFSIPASIASNTKNALELPSKYGSAYPDLSGLNNPSEIERDMAISAGIINANLGARVIHVTHGGYDHHTNQLPEQANRLQDLDQAIGTFFSYLSPGFADRVTVLVYSEFGRRVQENGTGTDHGRAALMMLMGNKVRGGIATSMPSLTTLDNYGNLVDTVDFRQVYAEVVSTWLRSDENSIIGSSYNDIGLFTSGPSGDGPIDVTPLPKVIRNLVNSSPVSVSSKFTERSN